MDPPKEYAVEAALHDLGALGALDATGGITDRGAELFGMPLDAALGNLLVEAQARGCLGDAIDLVSALAVGRPVFTSAVRPADPEDDLRADGCDGLALNPCGSPGYARAPHGQRLCPRRGPGHAAQTAQSLEFSRR